MDPASLAMAAAMVFGLLTADAVVSADTVSVQMSVPASVAQTGFTQDVAERIFVHEFERMNQTRSLLKPPLMRSAREPTIIGVVANSLRLNDFTSALQDLLGLERMRVSGAVVAGGAEGQRLLINSASTYAGAFSVEVRETGSTDQLIRRGAHATMEQVQPYRAALFQFDQVMRAGGSDFSAVEAIATRELARPRRAEVLTERSYLQNLLGIVALLRNDLDEAEQRFRRSFDWNTAFHIGKLNLAFVLIQRDRERDALAILTPLVAVSLEPRFAPSNIFGPLREALHSSIGMAQWGLGDLDSAEVSFQRAASEYPDSEAAFTYWSRLLQERGRAAEAADKAAVARVNALTFENYPEVATLYFWMTPRDNQPLTRRSALY